MRNRMNGPTDADYREQQSRIAAVLGPEEIQRFDDEAAAPLEKRAHNRPPELVDSAYEPVDPEIIRRVDREVASANAWAEQVKIVEDEETAQALVQKLDQLQELFEKHDAQRTAERNPHVERAAAVQKKWVTLLQKLTDCRKALKPLETAWHKLKTQRQNAERQAREQEALDAQRRAEQLDEQARAGGRSVVTNMIAAREAADEAERARKAAAAVPTRAKTSGTFGGRAHSLRVTWHASVQDWDLWYAHVKHRGEVRDVLSRLANEAVRSKDGPRPPDGQEAGTSSALPGCLIYSEES